MIEKLRKQGVLPGDRIAVYMKNSPLLIDLIFAAWDLGANICPLNTRLPPCQIGAYLERLQPKLYIDETGISARTAQPCETRSSMFLFTSGSTGVPKIAVLSKESLMANAASAIRTLELHAGDRWLLSLPLFHVGGVSILLRCALAKAKAVLDTHDPEITHLSFVPTQLYRATPIYKNLRCLLLGGGPVIHVPKHLPTYLTYGLTEMGSIVCAKKEPLCVQGRYYLGHPLPDREVRIAPDGEIEVRGKCLFQGYWEDGKLTLPLKDGWYPTGDLGIYCPEKGLAIVGRKDWQFISGGENIQPEEVERAILQCPEIQEVIVMGKPDPEFGARPIAFVRTTDATFTLEKMVKTLQHLLPKYKIPVAMYRLDEFPRKGLKVDRRALSLLLR